MIYGHIDEREQWGFLASHPVWAQAFAWLQALPADPPEGRVPLIGDEMYALVMRYDTVPAAQARFESHRRYIDLQFTIAGGEQIAWARAGTLAPDGGYDAVRDLQFYSARPAGSIVHKTAGHFSIYHPSDAHAPKIADGVHRDVFKAVIKIGRHLVG